MKPLIPLFFVSYIIFSCQKKGNTDLEEQPITVADSTFQIISAEKTDLNEFDIKYIVRPPANEFFTNIYLCWSTSLDFTTGNDSVVISTTPVQPLIYHIARLKEVTKYYGRIGLTYKGKRFYSSRKEWSTDSLKILSAGYLGLVRGFNKGDTSIAVTNLQPVTAIPGSDTKVLLGNYECPVTSDQGLTIQFTVPPSIPTGKYVFKIKTRGMEVEASDSTEVLRGDWSFVNSPPIPGNPNATASGLVFFGSCYSTQRGYIVGGLYFNGPQVPWPNSMWPEYILEFDEQQQSWTKKYPATARYFENPICYYY